LHGHKETVIANNGLWLVLRPYVMFTNVASAYKRWHNDLTDEWFDANIVTNSLGFNESRELSFTKPYVKAPNERVVLFTSGSAGWGVGATATDKTIAGRMEFYLNSQQSELKYTVINLSMGSWIAYQQYLGLRLWGVVFDPDWVVSMAGHNDAGVGCGYGQGVGNPMYFATVKSYLDAYMFSKARPTFYRGWLENELIKHSVAYRTLTGKEPIEDTQEFDETSNEAISARRQIIPTKMGEAREMLEFYLKAQKAMLNLFPNAGYILSTQPIVNQFSGEFVDIYDWPADSPERRKAMEKRNRDLETYLTAYEKQPCRAQTFAPTFVYIFGSGAIRLERLVDEARALGRTVEYFNVGLLFPDARSERIPYFIDAAHISDKGNDVIGKYYAERILAMAAKPKNEPKVTIVSATYGGNCGAPPGNVTRSLQAACTGQETCDYVVDVSVLGDAAPGCSKSFSVHYRCGSISRTEEVAPEAGFGTRIELCAKKIQIHSATYGGSCGAKRGNVSAEVRKACQGPASATSS